MMLPLKKGIRGKFPPLHNERTHLPQVREMLSARCNKLSHEVDGINSNYKNESKTFFNGLNNVQCKNSIS